MRNRIASFVLVSLLVLSLPLAAAEPKYFGYAGVTPTSSGAVKGAQIQANSLTLNWEETGRVKWYNRRGQKPIIIGDLLFYKVDPNITGPCQPWTMRLRFDWQARTDNYLAHYLNVLTPDRIAGIAILSESNNGCVSPESLQTVARYLLDRGIDRDLLGTGNGTSQGAKPLLDWFPQELGWVAVYDYNSLSPDQEKIAELKAKLSSDQRYILVPKGFFFFWEVGGPIPKWKIGWGVEQYAKYCAGDDQCMGVVVFLWDTVNYSVVDGTGLLGTDQMPPAWPGNARASRLLLGN